MRKLELVYLHALLAEVRQELASSHEIPEGTFQEYEAHGVGPQQIQRGKDAHKGAITRLLSGILRVIAEEDAPVHPDGISSN